MAREIIDFQAERGRHEALLGRADVLAALDELLEDGSSRWVLVKGGPGRGKSALLSEWLKRREEAGQRVPPHHFLRRGVEDWDRPEVVKRNLAAQVEELYPEQADAEARPESRLRELLQRVSREVLVPRGEGLVLVVDGLDEVEGEADGTNPLPRFLPHVLPPGVKVLCASRPTYPYLSWLEGQGGLRVIDLDGEKWAGSNREVVREYWRKASSWFEPRLTSAFVEEVVWRAEGNVLYAVKLAEWLREQPVEKRRVELLPRGMEALLEQSWERLSRLPEEERRVAVEGLGLLCVAREALPLSELEMLAGWKRVGDGERFLRGARSFLLEEPGPGRHEKAWRPFHESFRSFVLSKLGGQRERELHARLAEQLCRWPAGESESGFHRSYALRHGVTHWLRAREWEQARRLYTNLGYLKEKCQLAGVLSVEQDVLSAAVECPDHEREIPRALHRAIQVNTHWLRKHPEALEQVVYNRLRSTGWEAARYSGDLRFSEGEPALWLRHPVRTAGSERTLEGHESGVLGCAVTPDGRRVVSASGDGTLKVWELETGRQLASLEGHGAVVNACAMMPDGRRVVSASEDKTLKVWELETGRQLASLEGHGDKVNGCAVTPDGRRVVSASWDRTLKVWDVETGRQLASLEGHVDEVSGCAVTPDGRRVVSASWDNTLKVWDLETGRCLHTLYGDNPFRSVACSADVICAGDQLGNVWILELSSSVPRTSQKIMPLKEEIPRMTMRFPNPLLEAHRSNTLALFIGSGLSLGRDVQGDFPTWSQLPLRLLEACERFGSLDEQLIEAKRNYFKSRMRLEVMLAELGSLCTALGRNYQKALNTIFRPPDAAPGAAHEAVARLGVRAILTTNYDPLLEETRESPRRTLYTWKESHQALNDLESGRKVLLKVHGTAERHDTVVMSELEYHKVRADSSYQTILGHLLQWYTFLFIGYGMNDPLDLDLVLKWNAEAFKSAARRHYALLKDPSDNDRDRYEREYNVQVIPFSDYGQLPAMLDELGRSASPRATG